MSFFVYVLINLLNYVPRFCQMKDLIKICGKFHQYSHSSDLTHLSPPRPPNCTFFLKERGRKYWLPPLKGRIWKIKKKADGSMVQGQAFLKEGWGSWHFSFLVFTRFIIFTFRNYFTLCKIILCILKKTFFCHSNFMKKGHSKLSKN